MSNVQRVYDALGNLLSTTVDWSKKQEQQPVQKTSSELGYEAGKEKAQTQYKDYSDWARQRFSHIPPALTQHDKREQEAMWRTPDHGASRYRQAMRAFANDLAGSGLFKSDDEINKKTDEEFGIVDGKTSDYLSPIAQDYLRRFKH